MIDLEKLKHHIETLKLLLKYQKDSIRSSERASVLLPRTGIRGGRATTIQAKWSTDAEARDRIFLKAEVQSKEIFK